MGDCLFIEIQHQISDASYWTPERLEIVQEIHRDCRRFMIREGVDAATSLHRWLHVFRSAASAAERFGGFAKVLAGASGAGSDVELKVAILSNAIRGREAPMYGTSGAVARLWESISTETWSDPDSNPVEGEGDFCRSRIAERIFEDLQDEVLSRSEDPATERAFEDWMVRTMGLWQYRRHASFAAPKRRILDAIHKFSEGRIVEGGAGLGHWASLLDDSGCDVVAYDRCPVRLRGEKPQGNPDCTGEAYMPILEGDAAAMADHPEHTLLLIWPPHNQNMGLEHIETHHRAGGRKLVYIGEGEGGRCGSEEMFSFLEEHYDEVRSEALPPFRGDFGVSEVRFYERRV